MRDHEEMKLIAHVRNSGGAEYKALDGASTAVEDEKWKHDDSGRRVLNEEN